MSTPGEFVLPEQHAAVDDQEPALPLRPAVLEQGHVAADFLDAAQRDEPERTRDKGGGVPVAGEGAEPAAPEESEVT